MIIIDGQRSALEVRHFENLEQIIEQVMADDRMRQRVVTDVLVNDEAFSEIYPHQAEDMETDAIERVEIVSVTAGEMARNITQELYKVVTLMDRAGSQVAEYFRLAEDGMALELYSDLLAVNRDFLSMVAVLRGEFAVDLDQDGTLDSLSQLFSEMIEIQENEDWILLADLLEYEYLPLVRKTKDLVAGLREAVKTATREAAYA